MLHIIVSQSVCRGRIQKLSHSFQLFSIHWYQQNMQLWCKKPFVQLKDEQKLHVAWLKEAEWSCHLPSEVQASPITTPGGVWSYILSVLNNGLPTYSWRLSVVTSTAPSTPCTILRAALRNIYERKHEMEFWREFTLVCFLACTADTKTARCRRIWYE